MSLTYADLQPGQTVEFWVFDLQHGHQWERRQVIAVDWPSITLLDPGEDRQYEIIATQDLERRIRDVNEAEPDDHMPNQPEHVRLEAERDRAVAMAQAFNARLAEKCAEHAALREELAECRASHERRNHIILPESVRPDVLKRHYLADVVCDHERGLDNPVCACSLVHLGWHPSVGEAVDAWIAHLLASGGESERSKG